MFFLFINKYSPRVFVLIIIIIINNKYHSQESYDTLNEVVINSKLKSNINNASAINIKNDFYSTNLSDLLSNYSSLRLNNLGKNSLSTASIQGSTSGQVDVLWNGFRINSITAGSMDLNLLPSFFIDNIVIDNTAYSSINSNSFGNSISLQNTISNKDYVRLMSNITTNRQYNIGVEFNEIEKKYKSNTKLLLDYSPYTFKYKNNNGEIQKDSYGYNYLGFQHLFQAKLSKKDKLNGGLMLLKNNRLISNTLASNESNIIKRGFLDYTYFWNKVNWSNKIMFDHQLSKYLVYGSKYDNRNFYYQSFFDIDIIKNLYTNISYNINYANANNNYYNKNKFEHNIKIFAKHERNNIKINTLYNILIKDNKKYNNYFLGAEYKNDIIKYFINYSFQNRLPNYNDLYFPYGGNELLLPETNKNFKIGAKIEYKKLSTLISYTNTNTNNYIAWFPIDFYYWTPININYKKSNCINIHLDYKYDFKVFKNEIYLDYSYNKFVTDSLYEIILNDIFHDNILTLNYKVSYNDFSLNLNPKISIEKDYKDRSKNVIELIESNISIQYNKKFGDKKLIIGLHANNLANYYKINHTNYFDYAIPLRNYGISINFIF